MTIVLTFRKQLLSKRKIRARLMEDGSRPTITKTRIMVGKQQVLRLDEEAGGAMAPGLLAGVKAALTEEIKGCPAVIVSDYGIWMVGNAHPSY